MGTLHRLYRQNTPIITGKSNDVIHPARYRINKAIQYYPARPLGQARPAHVVSTSDPESTIRCSLCAIHIGLHSGKIAGLQWGDVDFNGKYLEVRRNIVQGRIIKAKTDKIRRVDLSDDLLSVLSELKQKRKEQWLSKGSSEMPEWVFCNQEGNPADMDNLKHRHFIKTLDKAKLRKIRFHDLRHTFASIHIQNGESLAWVKDQLGHSSIKMTVDVYGYMVPGANRDAANRLPSLGSNPEEVAIKMQVQKNLP